VNKRLTKARNLPFQGWLPLLALLICSAASATPALAQFVMQADTVGAMQQCGDSKFYNSRSPNAPAIIKNSFKGQGSVLTFRVCKDADSNTHYFVRKPRPNRNGICRIFEQELFPGTAKDEEIIDTLYDGTAKGWYFVLPGWKSWPPSDWEKLHYFSQSQVLAQQSASLCPGGEDVGYVPVTASMTDGMLNAFYDLWRKISASPAVFDKEFLNTKSDGYTGLALTENHAALVQALRSELFDKNGTRPSLEFLNCEIGTRPGCSAYFNSIVVGFDVTDTGMQIIRIDPILVP
jgi:hypothetical protein